MTPEYLSLLIIRIYHFRSHAFCITISLHLHPPFSPSPLFFFSIFLSFPCIGHLHDVYIGWKRVCDGLKGCGMGPWLILVSPCFRENVVATCKIGSFLCSLDNLLQKNVIVFFFGNQISKWRSFEKRAIFDLLFTFFSHQGKVTKISSARISLTYIHIFCSPYLPYQF